MRSKILIALVVACGLISIAVPVARAQGFRSGNTASVPSGETLSSTLWAAGNTIDVAGTVQGDVFCAGQNITISGTVEGDVICAGQNITVSGTVMGDVRAAGQTVNITGKVSGSASVAGQTASLSSDGQIGRDLSLVGSEITVAGQVGRDVFMGNERATIAGTIGRNVTSDGGKVRLDKTAVVGGRFDYTSREDASIDAGAQIKDGISHSIPPSSGSSSAREANRVVGVIMAISLFTVALVTILIAPQFVDAAARKTMLEPLKTFGVGVVFLFFAPMAVFGLLVSVIGIPVAILAFCLWIFVLMLTGPMFAYLLAKLIWRSQDSAILLMLVGCLILLICYLIPVVQIFVFLASLVFGSGMTVLGLMRALKRPSYRVAPIKAE